MQLDDVMAEILRLKLDDARFLAVWVADEIRLFVRKFAEDANPVRLAAFVAMVRADLAEAVDILGECERALCALNCACTSADNSNAR